MNKLFVLLLVLISQLTYGQENLTEKAQPIVKEGKMLYASEMASWYGTDIFLENYKNRDNIGGYFSYTENSIAKCIFFSKAEAAKVIGTISFDSTYNTKTAQVDLAERAFTTRENDLYIIRQNAMTEMQSDTMFKMYKNTSLNLIPLIVGEEKKVYVLTGTTQKGVVLFGNDYLLTFDNNNKVLVKKRLHNSLISIEYGKMGEGQEVIGAMHTHLPGFGEFITATDICTLMLYSRFAKWRMHSVVSGNCTSIWNCETNSLIVIPR